MTSEIVLEFDDNDLVPQLFGSHNAHLKYLESLLDVHISDRANTIKASGDERAIKKLRYILDNLWERLQSKSEVDKQDIDALIRFFDEDNPVDTEGRSMETSVTKRGDLVVKTKKKTIVPRSPNQAKYLQEMNHNAMVFGLGPAGTGKTYLAVAQAVSMFLSQKVERLIFCRPAVEAGERLGFLPGDMKEKIDPYLRPIYDALQDMLPHEILTKKFESGEIEIAPLAFMRGRTLARSFVILDEAQNTTTTQMQMFLTRMGEDSQMVINGDLSQTDLPSGVKSGLRDAVDKLSDVEEISFVRFEKSDVIRHKLVGKIIAAYESN